MVISALCVCYNITAFSLPLDELLSQYLMSHGQVTVAVISRDEGKEGKQVTEPVYGYKYQHRLHEKCNLMAHNSSDIHPLMLRSGSKNVK